jgi:hypothetical protein
MEIRPDIIKTIPLHDAEFRRMSITPGANGFINVAIEVKLNNDEDLSSLQAMGIDCEIIRISLMNAWQVVSSMYGYGSGPRTMDSWESKQNSDMLTELHKLGFMTKSDAWHHQLAFSDGSRLDIIAERIMVSTCTG